MSLAPLLLAHSDGMTTTFHGENKDIPASEKFVQAWVNGIGSYYIVYEKPNFNKDHPDAGYVILLDTPNMRLDWVIRSFRGFDCTGITLYQHRTFSGEAHNFTEPVSNLDKYFHEDGPKSIIVTSKRWQMFIGEDGMGDPIPASHTNIYTFTEGRFFTLEEGQVAKSLSPPRT